MRLLNGIIRRAKEWFLLKLTYALMRTANWCADRAEELLYPKK